MNEEALNDSFNLFASQGYNGSIEDYKELMVSNKDARADSYNLFTGQGYNGTDTDFNDLIGVSGQITLTDNEVGKTNDSANADPSAESNVTGSESGESLSASSNEKNTWLEDFFGEKVDAEDKLLGAVDFISDIYRSGKGGWAVGASVDESFDLFKSEGGMSEEDALALVEAGRNIESFGSTNEQIAASAKMKKLQDEGYSGVGAFLSAYWENPSALASTMASSLSMMASSFFDSEEVRYSAAAGSGAGAAVGAAGGAGIGAFAGGVGAIPGAIIGAKMGAVSGAMSGITTAMETGLTTAQLLEEQAISTGLDWGNMTDKQRIGFVMNITKDKEQFDELKNKALARGLTIGGVDFVVNMATFGVGKLVSGRIASSAASALTKPITGLAAGTTESVGAGIGEYLGQKAAGQEFNFEEIALEALADKQATVLSAVKNIRKGNPSYRLNGEKMNGKKFSEQLKIMDDVAMVKAKIEIKNSPGVQKLVDNRRQNIAADQKVDSLISGVEDRSEAIRLTKEQNKLKSNKEGNKSKLEKIDAELKAISEKYADSDVDVTIQERQEAVANAVETTFEENFNKNYKALKDRESDTGIEPIIFEDDNLFAETAAKDLNVTKEFIVENSPDGVFVGKGKVYINKNQAKRSIDIATGNNGAISVTSHEVLHPIFNALIGGRESQGQFVKKFKRQMTRDQKAYVNRRLKGAYKGQPGAEAIELMNIFSDGIIKGDINYDKSTFEKLGDSIVNLLRSSIGLNTNEISFEDGRGVFNFLKEYNTSVKEGKLSDKAIAAIKKAESKKGATKVADAKLLEKTQFSKQEILDLTEALDAAEEAYAADPNDPTLEKKVELAEKALDEAEERALSGTPAIKPVVAKPKEEKKKVVKREPKPVRTTNLAPQTAQDKKIMDTYNEGMKDTKRTSFTSSNPLPAKVENKLIPLFEGYINTLVQQKFKQYQSEALEFQDALSILRVEAVNALRTFNPARNENLSGYVRRLIALRQPKMFEKANKEFTSSLDDVDVAGDAGVIRSFANEETVAPENLIKASKVISPKVKNSLVSMLKAWASQNNIDFDLFRFGDVDANATVVVDGKKVTILHELLKELFPDVNPEKFLDSSTMFTGPEASIVLEKLASNEQELIELFINLLPRGAVMPKGKNKAIVKDANYGKSTKLDKSILTAFYNKGDVSERFTKDAGLIPFTLKDNVRYSDVHKAFGMDSAGNKLNYKRSGKGSAGPVLASAYKMLGRLIMNEIIRTDLGLTAEQKMNVGAGKSDLQFSFSDTKISKGLDSIGIKIDPNLSQYELRAQGRRIFIEIANILGPEKTAKYLVPIVSKSSFKWVTIEGKKELVPRKSAIFQGREDFFNELPEMFNNYIPGSRTISTVKKDKNGNEIEITLAIPFAQVFKNPVKFIKQIKERQKFAEDQRKGLFQISKELIKLLETPGNEAGVAMFLSYMNTNVNGLIRTAAIPKKMFLISPSLDGKPVRYRYEHSQTASDTLVELSQLIFDKLSTKNKFGTNPEFKKEFDDIMEGFIVSIIPAKYDRILNKFSAFNGERIGTTERSKYSAKLKKPGEDGIPTRYLMADFLKAIDDKRRKLMPMDVVDITEENLKAFESSFEFQRSINEIETTETLNKANNNANNINAKPKGISVWDFDDTLAKTKSNVLYTMPDGTKGKLNAEEFAKEGDKLIAKGANFDFSEFSKVVNGSKGPFFEKAIARNKKFGNKNVFILTARPANSANAIHEFLKGIGLNIPLENITGLANSSPQAKADWVVGKAAEGYNDFYFADDATQNVKAVDKALKKLPVKSKAELAVIKKSDIQFSMNTKYTTKWKGFRDIKGFEGHRYLLTNGKLKVGENTIEIAINDGAAPGSEVLNFEFPDLGTIEIGFDISTYDVNAKLSPKDTFKIFGAVINATTAKIKEYGDEVNAITFSGLGRSRSSLYTLMAQRYAAELGWKMKSAIRMTGLVTKEMEGNYVIYRPDYKPAFNEQPTEVKEVLKAVDIKSPQRGALQFSKSMNSEFNQMIEKKSGIDARGTISQYKAATMGRKKGRFQFFIPPGAEDFEGLMYKLLGKGTEGNEQAAWFKRTLFDPFAAGIKGLDAYKLQVANAVRLLKKSLKNIPKELGKRDPKTDFKYEDAVRVYLWKLNGHEIKGISASDIKALVDIVKSSPKLKKFARELNRTMGGYPAPQESWLAGTITTDAINMVNTIKRAEFLQTWQQNADIIFSEDNLNKLEAAFGKDYVEALKDSLYRMKSGRNRPSGANKLTNKFMNWVNDSVATIMFFNTRSALLQTLSTVNFINWGDNNPLMAAKAFGNQKQFWNDFSMLFNSDFLKSRRSGLKNDVNADEIANAAASQTNKAKAALAMLLKAGFLPTQIADSFAIAMGGATFYRNRMETYVKKGMPLKEAKEQAFLDFQEIAEATQQSSRPDRVSQQQASPLGRIILAFANTPMQYMRLSKKAFLDLKNGRGDAKTNITKILYYTAVQNIIFSSLQAALFATMFDDEEEEETKKKGVRVANTMLDSMLRGLGIYGAVASTVKNIVLEIDKQANKDRPDYSEAAIRALDISPPISSKIRKGRSAGRAFSYKNTREKMKGFGLDNPAYYAVGQITSATANIPLDRAIGKANHIRLAFAQETKFWQSVSLLLGFSEWDLNMIEKDKKKTKFGDKMKWKKRKLKKRKLK